jgi:hypothetical protein
LKDSFTSYLLLFSGKAGRNAALRLYKDKQQEDQKVGEMLPVLFSVDKISNHSIV